MNYDFYLQGSYRNDTNIPGDSDVDVVLEMNSTIQYDLHSLSQYEQGRQSSSFQPPTHTWNDFRREALKALETGFGRALVGQGNKSIKLKADPPRLAADIVVCMEHRKYTSSQHLRTRYCLLCLAGQTVGSELPETSLRQRSGQEQAHMGPVQTDRPHVQERP